MSMILRLSPFVMPQVRMGAVRMSTINMVPSPERLQYVRGFLRHLEMIVGVPAFAVERRDDVIHFAEHAYLGKLFGEIDWDAPKGPRVVPWEHAEDYVSFDRDHLGVAFLDGRLRNEAELVYIPTGEATPEFAALVAALTSGIERAELLDRAAETGIDLDDPFIDHLVERGVLVVEQAATSRVPARFAPRPGDRVAWLAHSSMIFQSGPTTVWFDPLLPPRIRYAQEELEIAFAPGLASPAYFTDNYGPQCEQLTISELPPPDAIVLSHPDVDHFDLGALMCVPASVPIVVPRSSPNRPWDVDMADTIQRILGPRTIIRQAHGETVRFGDIAITAVPFVGEFPKALPHDWNCFVVHGSESSIVLGNGSAIVPDSAHAICNALGDRGPSAILFTFDVFAGHSHDLDGFREAPQQLYPAARPWPWYLPIHRMFEPNPRVGIAAEVLRSIGQQTGLRRCFTYESGGAPWLTFQMPHLHRQNMWNMLNRVRDRQIAELARLDFELPSLKIGQPFTP